MLNSGIDLQFSVMKNCENKEAAYEVLRYLYEDETIQIYLNNQNGIACKDSEFTLPSMLYIVSVTEYFLLIISSSLSPLFASMSS